eukprot:scaffold238500_cov33-Tisochrysis_lutea.AAC.3
MAGWDSELEWQAEGAVRRPMSTPTAKRPIGASRMLRPIARVAQLAVGARPSGPTRSRASSPACLLSLTQLLCFRSFYLFTPTHTHMMKEQLCDHMCMNEKKCEDSGLLSHLESE